MITGFFLASLNAFWNITAFVLMAFGFVAIKQQERQRHKRLMVAAFVASCLFLTSYLTRIALFGDTHFQGTGALRIFYFAILISHILLAVAVAPMVITTLGFGLRERYASHKKLARITLPLWAYVSITGVIVYGMLYHLN